MPIYLRLAANTKVFLQLFFKLSSFDSIQDVVERFRLTIAFAVAGLYNGCKQLKPFNPILGETF